MGTEDAPAQPEAAVDAAPVVVDAAGDGDQFAFMGDSNPYANQSAAVGDEPAQAPAQTDGNDDPFASMVDPQPAANDDPLLMGGGDANGAEEMKQDEEAAGSEQKEKSEDEPTFLSVWQEERKLELEKRRTQEREEQKKQIEAARGELEKFESDRAKRIENKRKENREKEQELRDDLDAVFKHGTIWEQVGKMVNLNEKMTGLDKHDKERFRDLLIHLRNAKQ